MESTRLSGNVSVKRITVATSAEASASGRHLSTFCPPVSHRDAYQFTLIELIGGLCVQGVGKITYKCAQISPEGAPRRVIRFCCVPILKKTNSRPDRRILSGCWWCNFVWNRNSNHNVLDWMLKSRYDRWRRFGSFVNSHECHIPKRDHRRLNWTRVTHDILWHR